MVEDLAGEAESHEIVQPSPMAFGENDGEAATAADSAVQSPVPTY